MHKGDAFNIFQSVAYLHGFAEKRKELHVFNKIYSRINAYDTCLKRLEQDVLFYLRNNPFFIFSTRSFRCVYRAEQTFKNLFCSDGVYEMKFRSFTEKKYSVYFMLSSLSG